MRIIIASINLCNEELLKYSNLKLQFKLFSFWIFFSNNFINMRPAKKTSISLKFV